MSAPRPSTDVPSEFTVFADPGDDSRPQGMAVPGRAVVKQMRRVEGEAGVPFDAEADPDITAPPPRELLAWRRVNTEQVFETFYGHEASPAHSQQPVPEVPPGWVEKQPPTTLARRDDGPTGQYASFVGHEREPPRAAPELAEGATIAGRYRVTRRIGSGGFAHIYLVTDSEDYLQEEIVLKLVNEDLMRDILSREGGGRLNTHDDLIRAWRSKLKAWKVISEQEQAHIVRLLGVPRIVFEHGESYSVGMLMEYMPAGDLWQHFRERGAPRSREQLIELMRLFLSACRTVGVLHAHGLLHRDIKPSNFLLNAGRTQCKLSDFELMMEADEPPEAAARRVTVGTPIYMAPECYDARYSVQSDIYALGAMLYHMLSGVRPGYPTGFGQPPPGMKRARPEDLPLLNPLVSSELNEAVLWCLSDDPAARPASVGEVQDELARLGLAEDAANIAPVNLARLLLTHLPEDEVRDLVEALEENGFHSASTEPEQRRRDIIEEYCYTASPYDVLRDNCTTRQLKALTKSLGLKEGAAAGRDDLIEEVLTSVGFLAKAREVPGLDATRTLLENLRVNLAHTTTIAECVGMVQAGQTAVERTVDLLLSFYGQLLLGTRLPGFLRQAGNGKPPERLTFGEKVGALRRLCSDAPPPGPPARVRQVFKFPLVTAEVFERLGQVVKRRNIYAHSPRGSEHRTLAQAQRSGRQLLEHAIACLTELAQSPNVPRVVQIVSRQDDVYGRHFYLGRDDHGRSERIFTPLPLSVGRLYLFFPLTNPARINPLIFPLETHA